MHAEFDMFGNRVRAGHGQKGRPPYQVTERNRNKVKLLLALGWSAERIAGAIEASVATLRKYFTAELAARDAMRDRLDAERIMTVAEQAMDGNVGAAKLLQGMLDRSDRMEAERKVEAVGSDKSDPGKKQLAKLKSKDAEDALLDELNLEVRIGERPN